MAASASSQSLFEKSIGNEITTENKYKENRSHNTDRYKDILARYKAINNNSPFPNEYRNSPPQYTDENAARYEQNQLNQALAESLRDKERDNARLAAERAANNAEIAAAKRNMNRHSAVLKKQHAAQAAASVRSIEEHEKKKRMRAVEKAMKLEKKRSERETMRIIDEIRNKESKLLSIDELKFMTLAYILYKELASNPIYDSQNPADTHRLISVLFTKISKDKTVKELGITNLVGSKAERHTLKTQIEIYTDQYNLNPPADLLIKLIVFYDTYNNGGSRMSDEYTPQLISKSAPVVATKKKLTSPVSVPAGGGKKRTKKRKPSKKPKKTKKNKKRKC